MGTYAGPRLMDCVSHKLRLQGLDWHGPSAQEAWSSVEALHSILDRRDEWCEWGFTSQSKVLLMGHSNGGQGAWYLAARNPDRIVGGECS